MGQAKMSKTKMGRELAEEKRDILVFIVRRDTKCSECGEELWSGSFLYLEKDKALCLSCADLGHLEYLSSGDAALTRRSMKYSRIHAKVLKWSKTRKRYERQGILVEPEAIEKAEKDCLADADIRELKRQRAEIKRKEEDQKYIEEYADKLRKLFPGCPVSREFEIAKHACQKYSGRVGRSAASKEFDPEAITLAVQAHVRHEYTNYDELLMRGWDRLDARYEVRSRVVEILDQWRQRELGKTVWIGEGR
ncbi:MAG TPA: DUF2293 domain-containing protein [Thermodesulfobacteriota bacterium]|nr:DUF2293 domain-containing protein [Thermodesulfobacteriota bacterium]